MPLHHPPRLRPLGDGAVTVQFGDEVSADANARVIGFTRALIEAVQSGRVQGVLEWVPAFAAVTVIVDDASEEAAAERDAVLLELALKAPAVQQAGRRWRLPACFDPDLAPDLPALADARGLSARRVIELLATTPLRVYMLGFLPGFPYMGDLPAECEVPRLSTPRRAVPARSIAVAGRMCAIYPWQSPGGWHLVGRTPVRLFDATADEPALLRAGDEVRWRPIDTAEFQALERQAEAGRLAREQWLEPAP